LTENDLEEELKQKKTKKNLNKPTISADQSWAYLNFGTLHKHRFLYDTGMLVTLITPQTFELAKWERSGNSTE
jgi:hypothetical protein